MNKFFSGSEYQKGYGLGGRLQHGGFGLGGLFSKFFNFVKPYLTKAKEFALPILKSGAQTVGKEVVKTATDIAKDLLEGKDFKNSAKERISNSVDTLKQKADAQLSGSGYKRRRKIEKNAFKRKLKKKRILDIFD